MVPQSRSAVTVSTSKRRLLVAVVLDNSRSANSGVAMQYVEAFERMGYSVPAPRQDWTAESDTGICITLWRSELGFRNGKPWVDTRVHAGDNSIWKNKPGNRKRIAPLQRALDEFDGWVDAIIVHGHPGESYGSADPWILEDRRQMRWQVTWIDPETGHFTAEPMSYPKRPAA